MEGGLGKSSGMRSLSNKLATEQKGDIKRHKDDVNVASVLSFLFFFFAACQQPFCLSLTKLNKLRNAKKEMHKRKHKILNIFYKIK